MARRVRFAQRAGAVAVLAVASAGAGSLLTGPPESRGAVDRHVSAHARIVVLPCSGSSASFLTLPSGARVVSLIDVEACATGRVTVSFAGDRASGCAAHGLCAYRGAETWDARGAGELQLLTYVRHGRRTTITTLDVGGFGPSIRSVVDRGGGGRCRDRGWPGIDWASTPVHHGRVEIGLRTPGLAALGTRCAGPLVADVASMLPRRTVSLAQLRRGHLRVDLDGAARFAAGGFSGTVDADVTLSFGRREVESVPRPVAHRVATARYRIERLAGAATATVRASDAPAACAPLDACGLRGTIVVTPRPSASATVSLWAAGRRNRSRRDLLSALGVVTGGHPAGVAVFGSGLLGADVTGRAVMTRAGRSCRDRTAEARTGMTIQRHGDRLRVAVSPFTTTGADPLRSRCPGPGLGPRAFSSASLPMGALRRRRLRIRLHGTSFRDGPYDVVTHSSLVVTLRRTAVTVRATSG